MQQIVTIFKQAKKVTGHEKKAFFAIALILLMAGSTLSLFVSQSIPNVNAQTTTTLTQTTIPSDMLQYEWPVLHGSNTNSFASDGPGPSAANIAWKTGSDVNVTASTVEAFNGFVFAQNAFIGTLYALDGGTGEVIWTGPYSGGLLGNAISKIDDTYMLIGSTCLFIANGTKAWD